MKNRKKTNKKNKKSKFNKLFKFSEKKVTCKIKAKI